MVLARIEKKNTLFGKNNGNNREKHLLVRALVRIRAKIEKKTPWWLGLVRKLAKIKTNTVCGMAFVRIRAKIEKKTLCGKAFVRIRAK